MCFDRKPACRLRSIFWKSSLWMPGFALGLRGTTSESWSWTTRSWRLSVPGLAPCSGGTWRNSAGVRVCLKTMARRLASVQGRLRVKSCMKRACRWYVQYGCAWWLECVFLFRNNTEPWHHCRDAFVDGNVNKLLKMRSLWLDVVMLNT